MRHNCLYNTQHNNTCSFDASIFYFTKKTNQTEKILNSEQSAPGRDNNEWVLWCNVCPIKRYGSFASLRVEKENTTFPCQPPYVIYFKLDISEWMKRVNNPEGSIVQILLGCS